MSKKNRDLIFYISIVLFFGFLMWGILQIGNNLESGRFSGNSSIQEQTDPVSVNNFNNNTSIIQFFKGVYDNLKNPFGILILQIISIIITARVFGYFFTKIKQPTVIGEIVAGIFLGPSILGMFFPGFSSFLFPVESLHNLQLLSQIGLVFFMFIIGMELDISVLQNKAHAAVVISHSSIIFPYFLGMLLAYFLFNSYAPPDVSFLSFSLFMGIAMSITAFPVLARIIQERGMTKTNLGTLAITCAAADDVTAWCILAAVVAIVNAGSIISSIFTIGLSILYVIFMLKVVRPFLNRIGSIYISKEILSRAVVAFVFLLLFASAFITEIIGIHALFGAFLAGTIMPQKTEFKKIFIEKIEDISLVLLLPLFFVFTGLRTQIGLLNDVNLWLVCFTIISVAVIGKLGGSTLAARFVGLSWKDALSLGTLMNTRGLMELIVLNIGYDLGILSAEIFAMLVLMALITTFLTGPALNVIEYYSKKRINDSKIHPSIESFKILISFGYHHMGSKLLRLANILSTELKHKDFTALHLTPTSEINVKDAQQFEIDSFEPIRKTAHELGLSIKTVYKASGEVQKEIVKTTETGNYNLLLLGSAKSPFTEDKLGGKIRLLLENTECDVGVFIDNNFTKAENVLMILNGKYDLFIKKYLGSFVKDSKITVLSNSYADFKSEIFFEKDQHINIHNVNEMRSFNLKNYDLLISSLYCWQALDDQLLDNIENEISVLIIKGKDE